MKRKWLALMMAGLMCVAPVLGMAEEQASFDASQVAPLLDAVASAALGTDAVTLNIAEDEALTEALLPMLMTALRRTGLADGATVSDAEAQTELLANLFAMPLPELKSAVSADAKNEALTLRVLTADVSEDGGEVKLLGDVAFAEGGSATGWRAAVILRADDKSPVGWKLCCFTVTDEALLEELTDLYFARTMMEYVNTACGYSIQYPALFSEDLIVETAAGVQAELADGTTSFSVARVENAEGLTLEALLAREQENDPATLVVVDEITGAGRSYVCDEEGIVHEAIFIVSAEYVYQAELNYPQDQAEDYALYVDYMMNSFSAEGLGVG